MSFTPGPWRQHIATTVWTELIEDSSGQRVASVCETHRTRDESQANARLISAAPEMLSVLENTMALIDDLAGSFRLPDYRFAKIEHDIADVIAKAKGI